MNSLWLSMGLVLAGALIGTGALLMVWPWLRRWRNAWRLERMVQSAKRAALDVYEKAQKDARDAYADVPRYVAWSGTGMATPHEIPPWLKDYDWEGFETDWPPVVDTPQSADPEHGTLAQALTAYPFAVIVVGSGMSADVPAELIYRRNTAPVLRVPLAVSRLILTENAEFSGTCEAWLVAANVDCVVAEDTQGEFDLRLNIERRTRE